MKITKLHIDHYEQLDGFRTELNSPFTIIYGPNEAGKSTIHRFITYMLYGAGPKEKPMSKQFGGRLWLSETDKGSLLLERQGDRPPVLHTDEGAAGGEAELKRMLDGTSEQTFRHLYAFSLTELQEIRTLQTDELQAYLFAAGTGIRPSAIFEAEKKLQTEMDRYFRPRGQNQMLNKWSSELDQSAKQIRALKERSMEFAGLQGKIEQSEAEIEQTAKKLEAALREKEWLELCLKARPSWIRWIELKEQLKQLPAFGSFPEQAMARFEWLQDQMTDVRSERRIRQSRAEQHRAKLESIEVRDSFLMNRSSLEKLFGDAALYQNLQQQQSGLLQEYEAAGSELAQGLRKIGESLTEERLMQLVIALDDESLLRSLAEKDALLERKRSDQERQLQQLKEALQTEKRTRDEWEHERKREARVLESALPDALVGTELRDVKSSMSAWRSLYDEFKEWSMKAELARQRMSDASYAAVQARSSRASSAPSASGRRRTSYGWVAVSVAALAAPLYFIWNQEWLPGIIISFMWIILAVSLWLGGGSIQGSNKRKNSMPQASEFMRQEQEYLSEMKRLWQQMSRICSDFGMASAQVAAASETTGGTISSRYMMDVKRQEQELLQLEAILQTWEEHQERLRRFEQKAEESWIKCRQTETVLKQSEHELLNIQSQQEEIGRECMNWLHDRGLPESLSPNYALLLLEQIEKAQNVGRLRQQLRDKLEELGRSLREYEEKAKTLLELEHDDVLAGVYQGRIELERQLELEQQRKALLLRLEEDEQAGMDLEEKESYLQGELLQLFRAAGADDEDGFRRRVQLYEQVQACKREIGQIEALLHAWAGEDWEERLRSELEHAPESELARRLQNLLDQIQLEERRLSELRELKGRQRLELEQLMNGTELAVLELQHESLLAQFQHAAERWIVHAAALRMIQETKAVFEKERRPEVLQYASECFSMLTGGAYTSVYSPLGERRFVVEHSSGARWDPVQLSRGTVEQLYLAIRLAMVREYGKKVRLPIVLDDILVNFDEERMKLALRVLNEHAQKQQVICFTCHRHVAEAARQTCPEADVIRLD